MDFKLPNNNFNENQIKLLETIQLSQKNILTQFSDLNKRISELEHSQQAVISKISHQNKSDEPLSFSDRLDLNIFLTLAVTLIICIALIVFGWHFWDIPSQIKPSTITSTLKLFLKLPPKILLKLFSANI